MTAFIAKFGGMLSPDVVRDIAMFCKPRLTEVRRRETVPFVLLTRDTCAVSLFAMKSSQTRILGMQVSDVHFKLLVGETLFRVPRKCIEKHLPAMSAILGIPAEPIASMFADIAGVAFPAVRANPTYARVGVYFGGEYSTVPA